MAIRITGLNSGLDTDSIVQELVSAYRTKTEKYEKAQTKLEWTQDAWKEMNTKIYGFYSKSLSNMRLQGNFTSKKTTTVADSSKAKVVANSSVINGTQTLKINKLATAGYLTGTKLELEDGKKVSTSTRLSELGLEKGTLKLKVGEEEKSIEVTKDMTVKEFLSALKEEGINASFDSEQQRFFLSSSASGTANDFEFVVENEADLLQLKKLGLASAQDMLKLTAKSDVQEVIQYQTMKEAGVTGDMEYADYLALSETEQEELWKQWETAFEALAEDEQKAAETAAKKKLVENFNANQQVTVDADKYDDAEYIEERLAALEENYFKGLMESQYDSLKADYAVKADASNAEIELNGAVFESDSNEFSINGLEITATGVSDLMTITTATDVDGIYDMIKDFFGEYNTLVNAMEAAYNADSSKGYEPLTDDERSELSDEEIEKWEKKIKDSLLRRDDTLNSVLSSMSMAMSKTYEINGKTYSLSSFGIKTAGYFTRAENESYAYHIDGDKDDETSEGNADKLRAAIADDPEAVTEFFTRLAKDVYGALDQKMQKTSLSSSYTVYNDIQLKNEYNEYTETIEKWEEKLKDLEDYYYDKFSAMETALANLQSQTNSLTSLLGG